MPCQLHPLVAKRVAKRPPESGQVEEAAVEPVEDVLELVIGRDNAVAQSVRDAPPEQRMRSKPLSEEFGA